jgi:poly-gamma-glutamate synthesis protein (capsule biosynthesis protein)
VQLKISNLKITLTFFILLFPGGFSNLIWAQDATVTANISVVGDLMCHSVQFEYSQVEADSFDFNPVYRLVKKYLSSSDFTFGNLETVTAGKDKKYSGYPRFNAPDSYISALKNAGFDLLTTANNHALDKSEKGVLRTIKILNENGINYNGTYISENDRDSLRIIDIEGIKIAFLAYSYGTNGQKIPKGKPYLINLINFAQIKNDVLKAKMSGSDLVLVHLHYGTEYLREPDKYEKNVVDSLEKYGADIIIGGHPHAIQPLKYFQSDNLSLDSGFVAYSMGNFFSNQRWRYSDAGVILTLAIQKNFTTGKSRISKIDFIPTWVFKGKTNYGNEFVIIPSQYYYTDDVMNYLSKKDFNEMVQAFSDTRQILLKYITSKRLNSK